MDYYQKGGVRIPNEDKEDNAYKLELLKGIRYLEHVTGPDEKFEVKDKDIQYIIKKIIKDLANDEGLNGGAPVFVYHALRDSLYDYSDEVRELFLELAEGILYQRLYQYLDDSREV